MKIKEYVREIKIRGIYIIISGIITMICAYKNWWEIIEIAARPLEEAQEIYIEGSQNERTLANTTNMGQSTPLTTLRKETFHFIITEITEAFMAATELSIFIAINMTIPIIMYQIWLFIKPGLYEYEKKGIKKFCTVYSILSIINVIITYWIILPATCKLFLSQGGFEMNGTNINEGEIWGIRNEVPYAEMEEVRQNIRGRIEINLEAKIYTYVRLVEKTIIAGQLLLQIPAFILQIISIVEKKEIRNAKQNESFSSRILSLRTYHKSRSKQTNGGEKINERDKVLDYGFKQRKKKRNKRSIWYILGIIISGIIAPPDIISQIIIAIPIIMIYEITIYLMCIKIWEEKYKKLYKERI